MQETHVETKKSTPINHMMTFAMNRRWILHHVWPGFSKKSVAAATGWLEY
jgi:hypothetical protein